MIETPPREKPYTRPDGPRRGLLIVNTGNGKGKTTAAIGLAVRAVRRGKSVRIFQFMKVGVARFGEHRALEKDPGVVRCRPQSGEACTARRVAGTGLIEMRVMKLLGKYRPNVVKGRAVMVCGTTSGAGKSFLATALARWYARQGLKVAPFKAQNMSNNARVAAGGEMGSAQYLQALAARAVPDVRMNPILLKPDRDTSSQVILLGQRRDDLTHMEWRSRAALLWPTVKSCLDGLLLNHDVVVIEGAGSPAEINLQSTDIVNMRVAQASGAATLIVCDIDRGGAFAHLYGTVELLPPEQRALIRGFVLNKFRGDPRLLAPGPETPRTAHGRTDRRRASHVA